MKFIESNNGMYFIGKAENQLIQEKLTKNGHIELNIVNNFWPASYYPSLKAANSKVDYFITSKKIEPPLTIYKLNPDDTLKPITTTLDIILSKEENLTEENELKRMKKYADKRQKGLGAFVKLDAGNVEKGIEMFNAAASGNTSGDTGIAEALEKHYEVIYENPENTKINGVELFDNFQDAKNFIKTLPKNYYSEILEISVDEETGEAHEEVLTEDINLELSKTYARDGYDGKYIYTGKFIRTNQLSKDKTVYDTVYKFKVIALDGSIYFDWLTKEEINKYLKLVELNEDKKLNEDRYLEVYKKMSDEEYERYLKDSRKFDRMFKIKIPTFELEYKVNNSTTEAILETDTSKLSKEITDRILKKLNKEIDYKVSNSRWKSRITIPQWLDIDSREREEEEEGE